MVQQQRIGDREIRALWERWPWLAAATGAAVVMVSGYYVIRAQSFSAASPSEVPIVVEPEITTITALGRLEPAGDVISLSAPSASERARVEKLLVKQGDRITVGQTIAILDTYPLLQAAVVEAERNVAIAKAELARVEAGAQTGDITAQTAEVERLRLEREDQIAAQSAALRRIKATRAGDIQAQQAVVDRIQAELDNAQADVKRYRTLKSEGAITVTELERFELTEKTARKRLQEAEAALTRTQSARQAEIDEAEANLSRIQLGQRQQIRSATATLDRITEVRPEDVQAAQAQVKAAEASVATAKLSAQQATVRSSQNGMVLKIHTRAGERLRPEGILDVGQTQTMTRSPKSMKAISARSNWVSARS
ncbi:MAG: biotin/lipoyl-binding protein [Synechococcales cyanobacterium CRU_2_2]|nr:biotin/lipoyl-binding protein [Synechococcales cyanobacterium CRU_2_2]